MPLSLLAAILLLWLCHGLAQLFWMIMPEEASALPVSGRVINLVAADRGASLASRPDRLAGMLQLRMGDTEVMGQFASGSTKVRQANVDSRLNLQLRGTVVSNQAKSARAIIAEGDKQEVLAPGESLSLGPRGVSLVDVHWDRVTLDNNGRLETLWMDERRTSRQGDTESGVAAVSMSGTASHPQAGAGLPSGLDEFAEVRLGQDAAGRQGLQLRARGDGRMFRRLGLRNEDLLLAVNEVKVGEQAWPTALSRELEAGGRARLQVMRNGEELTLVVDLDSLSTQMEQQ